MLSSLSSTNISSVKSTNNQVRSERSELDVRYFEATVDERNAETQDSAEEYENEESSDEAQKEIEREVEMQMWDIVTKYLLTKMPSPLPPFEKDSTTLSLLWNVYCQDMESQKLTTIKMEANKKLYEDWKTTADRLNKILGSYGISKTSSFSKTTQKHLSLLAELADVLDIGDGKTTSYYKAILRLQSDKRKSENDFQSIMTSIDRLKSKREELSVEFEKLNRLTQKLRLRADEDEQSIKEYRRNFTMLQYKESEYKDKLTRLEETYSAHPIHTHSLRYPHLLSLQNTVSEVQSRLSNDKNKLHSFNGLPPDLDLARLKVLEASKQLEELKNVRDELLESMVKTVIEGN